MQRAVQTKEHSGRRKSFPFYPKCAYYYMEFFTARTCWETCLLDGPIRGERHQYQFPLVTLFIKGRIYSINMKKGAYAGFLFFCVALDWTGISPDRGWEGNTGMKYVYALAAERHFVGLLVVPGPWS